MIHVEIAAAARSNDAFRRVLHTTGHVQLVVMTLQPGEDIGAEVHEHNDQVLSFIDGGVRADVAGETRQVGPGDVVVVPAGTEHNFTNTFDVRVRVGETARGVGAALLAQRGGQLRLQEPSD